MATRSSLKNVMRLLDAASKDLPPEQSFLNDLKRSIELDDEKGAKLPSQTYKPSGMNCIRAMYYQIIGKEVKVKSAGYMMVGICNSGTDIHVRIQNAIDGMKKNDIDCQYVDVEEYIKARELDYLEIREKKGNETKLYHKNLNMSFMVDGIIRYQGKYYILELKTETINKWRDRTCVDEKHHNQATAYALSLNLNDVLFVYINRDLLDMKSFIFHVTDDMKQELIGKITDCDSYVQRMITPPKPENVTRRDCEYCMYREVCSAEG